MSKKNSDEKSGEISNPAFEKFDKRVLLNKNSSIEISVKSERK